MVTKREVMGVIEKLESARKRLRAISENDPVLADIIVTDIDRARAQLDYILERAQ